jgi:(aminoalkyl)phosphonate N-acetyltransferase
MNFQKIVTTYFVFATKGKIDDVMENKLNIRKINANDLKPVFQFVSELEEAVFDPVLFEKAFERNINNPDFIYLIAEINNKPVGYLCCHSQLLLHHGGLKIAEIQEMYVSSENRSMGIGKRLISELKQLAKQEEIMQIEVSSNIERHEAHSFYERENFVQSHKKFIYQLP